MQFKSFLKPDGSIGLGIATGLLVVMIYKTNVPETAITHATDAHDTNIDAARKKATWTSIGVLSAITLLTHDINVFVLGGLVTIAEDWNTRHANATNPATGALVSDLTPTKGKLSVVSAQSA